VITLGTYSTTELHMGLVSRYSIFISEALCEFFSQALCKLFSLGALLRDIIRGIVRITREYILTYDLLNHAATPSP
jgi:hypothetical protein